VSLLSQEFYPLLTTAESTRKSDHQFFAEGAQLLKPAISLIDLMMSEMATVYLASVRGLVGMHRCRSTLAICQTNIAISLCFVEARAFLFPC
jgi:hypothetical protein